MHFSFILFGVALHLPHTMIRECSLQGGLSFIGLYWGLALGSRGFDFICVSWGWKHAHYFLQKLGLLTCLCPSDTRADNRVSRAAYCGVHVNLLSALDPEET